MARAVQQIQDKQPVPEMDFTQHHLDDGTIISTQERVIKDVRVFPPQIYATMLKITRNLASQP